VRLFPADFDAWLQKELASAERRGYAEALSGKGQLIDLAAERIDRAREEAEAKLGDFASRFAEGIARELLHIELEAGHHAIEKMVRESLAQSGVGRGACEVHVHPDDAEALAPVTFRSGTTISADPGIARGSVHITTAQGLLVREVDLCIKHAADLIHAHMRQKAQPGPARTDEGGAEDA
jgi:flagellar biosynthesis/type III secretory pathway protein FliH